MPRQNIVVLGAGSIGAFVGGCLMAALADVRLIGRAAMRWRIERHGLVMSGLHGWEARVPAHMVRFSESPEALAGADLVIVAVKSAATAAAALQIAQLAPVGALVVSFQNGTENVATLRELLPRHTVVGGMVPFNVVQTPDGRLHRGTPGEIVVEAHALWAPWLPVFRSARLPLHTSTAFREVQWGKLIVNLNNAVNALSGRPLRTQLSARPYRLVLAQLIDEALAALDAAGIEPAQLGGTSPAQRVALLRLSDARFSEAGGQLANIDPRARSSMWEDLEAGRITEVEELNGAVARLARAHGVAAATNEAICTLVHAAERGGERHIDGDTLARLLNVAQPAAAQDGCPALSPKKDVPIA